MKKVYILLLSLLYLIDPVSAALLGSNLNNPIYLGVLTTGVYSSTNDNSPSNGFGNNYTGPNNQSSDDIFYSFRIYKTADVTISTCGSGIKDSYLHLLDDQGEHIISDDDEPKCTSNYLSSSITITLEPGYYWVVAEGYGAASGSITTNIDILILKDISIVDCSYTKDPTSVRTLNFSRTFTWIGLPNNSLFKTKYYISNDFKFSPDDQLIETASDYIRSTNAEASTSVVSLQLPPNLPLGKQYIIVVVDAENSLKEINEYNNTYSILIDIQGDLEIIRNTYTYNPNTPNTLTYSSTRLWSDFPQNTKFTVGYYLSKDSIIIVEDVWLKSMDNSVFYSAPYFEYIYSFVLQIPSNTPLGKYYIISVIDKDNLVTETNENNNILASEFYLRPSGGAFEIPINLGEVTQSSPKTAFNNNSTANWFGDSYTGPRNQPSDDIFYKFNIEEDATVEINLSSSNFDTYLHLLDDKGNWIASNDDYFGLISFISQSLTAGTYYVVCEGYSQYSGNINLKISLSNARKSVLAEADITPFTSLAKVNIKVYPNPASDYMTIESDSDLESATVQFFQLDGKLAKVVKLSNPLKSAISISDLSSGSYILNISNSNSRITKRLEVIK